MKDAAQSLLSTGVIQLANIASGVLLARILLPDGRGELAAAMLWPTLVASLGVLGIHEAVTYHASRGTHANSVILCSGLVLAFVLSAVLMPLGAIAVELALTGYRPEVLAVARLYLLFIPLNFVGLIAIALFQGALRFGEWNLLRTLVHVTYTVLIVLFHVVGWSSIEAFAAAYILANLVLAVTALAIAASHGWIRPRRPVAARNIIAFGSRVHASAIVQILGERLDQIVISVLLSAASLGLYVVAITVARLITVPAATFATLVFPKVARAGDSVEQARILGRYLRATLATTLAGIVVVVLCADWILNTFFGPTFGNSAGLVQTLAVASFLLACKTVVSAGLKGMGELRAISYGEIAGLVVSAVSLAFLLPALGVIGAAIAAILGQAASLAVLVNGLPRSFGPGAFALLRPTADETAGFAKVFLAVGLWLRKR